MVSSWARVSFWPEVIRALMRSRRLLFVAQTEEGAVGGEVEVESALGAGLADAFADSVVFLALDVRGELFEFGFGERSEGGLEAWFFHSLGKLRVER
jgi:hypothetical protein